MYDLDAYVAHFRDAFRRRDQAPGSPFICKGCWGTQTARPSAG